MKNRRLLLVGGGHSHAIALREWGKNPLSDVSLSLMSDVEWTPYSGMLPGLVAGRYHYAETHIYLPQLAQLVGAEWIVDRAIGLDLDRNHVIGEQRGAIAFDIVSFDIGSTPALTDIPGAAEYTIPAKPVPQFLTRWQQLSDRLRQAPDRSLRIAIVGGGIGGVELAFNMQVPLEHHLKTAHQPLSYLSIHLFQRGTQLVSGRSKGISQRLERELCDRKICLHLGSPVVEILPTSRGDYDLITASDHLTVDAIISVTQATAPAWLKKTGLALDSRGFIAVNPYLQSISHPHVFAAGDIASLISEPCPKAGVFAVRQGKPLAQNVHHFLHHQPLQAYKPQKRYLSLLGTGDGRAIALWGNWSTPPHALLWWWKDHIDRQFMTQFSKLPTHSTQP
jgi:selenide,water dikinase